MEIDAPVDISDAATNQLSEQYVGRWTQLISTTNWEKGKIICGWRQALVDSGAPAASYSDQAWSQRVGGVTSQHVGRLRRVSERFAQQFSTFQGLYWSHFLAALEWDDAEMWLEGAVQSQWSVSEMRRARWEVQGADPAAEPKDAEIAASSLDEDFVPLAETTTRTSDSQADADDAPRDIQQAGPRYDDPDFGDADDTRSQAADDDAAPWEDVNKSVSIQSPFAGLPELPPDLSDAVEQFKLAIIHHRSNDWAEVSPDTVVKALQALSSFTLQDHAGDSRVSHGRHN
ncbi:MAG: hypothetical protein KF752_12465 [Pirellulaceae bacterium]|nr:hypothetical protein [Pirellulaceae bacterium]